MKNIVIVFFLFLIASCNFFSIDKAHYHYKKDPKGYSECKDAKLIDNVMPCSDTTKPSNLINPSMVNDTSQFNWLFWGNIHGMCYGQVPTVDLTSNSFIFFSVHGYGQESYIKKSKVLIDNTNKIILCKFLVRLTPGACDVKFYEGYIIPKVTNDYEVKIESWTTDF